MAQFDRPAAALHGARVPFWAHVSPDGVHVRPGQFFMLNRCFILVQARQLDHNRLNQAQTLPPPRSAQ